MNHSTNTTMNTGLKSYLNKLPSIVKNSSYRNGLEYSPSWRRIPFKHAVTNLTAKGYGDNLPFIALENIIAKKGCTTEETTWAEIPSSDYVVFQKDDVLFGKLRPYLRKFLLAPVAGCAPTELLVFRSRKNVLKSKYLFYIVQSELFINKAIRESYGVKMPRTSWEKLSTQEIGLPPLDTQSSIISFLDRETKKIDLLIEKKNRLVQLLSEKRSALITHTVTKGLDPEASFKDSGIEWLGKIPKHWLVKKLKYVSLKIGSGKTPKGGAESYVQGGIPLIRSQNVKDSGLEIENVVFIDADTDREMCSSRIYANDVLLNITGASLGRSCHVPASFLTGNVNQHVCIIRPQNMVLNAKFLAYTMISTPLQAQIFSSEDGVSREGLNFAQVGRLNLAIPPLKEQEIISEYIDQSKLKIDRLISKIHEHTEKLQEYRSALITAAVTGQIDVREK